MLVLAVEVRDVTAVATNIMCTVVIRSLRSFPLLNFSKPMLLLFTDLVTTHVALVLKGHRASGTDQGTVTGSRCAVAPSVTSPPLMASGIDSSIKAPS